MKDFKITDSFTKIGSSFDFLESMSGISFFLLSLTIGIFIFYIADLFFGDFIKSPMKKFYISDKMFLNIFKNLLPALNAGVISYWIFSSSASFNLSSFRISPSVLKDVSTILGMTVVACFLISFMIYLLYSLLGYSVVRHTFLALSIILGCWAMIESGDVSTMFLAAFVLSFFILLASYASDDNSTVSDLSLECFVSNIFKLILVNIISSAYCAFVAIASLSLIGSSSDIFNLSIFVLSIGWNYNVVSKVLHCFTSTLTYNSIKNNHGFMKSLVAPFRIFGEICYTSFIIAVFSLVRLLLFLFQGSLKNKNKDKKRQDKLIEVIYSCVDSIVEWVQVRFNHQSSILLSYICIFGGKLDKVTADKANGMRNKNQRRYLAHYFKYLILRIISIVLIYATFNTFVYDAFGNHENIIAMFMNSPALLFKIVFFSTAIFNIFELFEGVVDGAIISQTHDGAKRNALRVMNPTELRN